MKKIIVIVFSLLTLSLSSFLFCQPVKNALCNVLQESVTTILKKQCVATASTSADDNAALVSLKQNLLAPQPRLADTSRSMPVTALKCAKTPLSNLVINVKDHGAKGDGVNDDTAAIQTAVNMVKNTGGTVLIPPGTYQIDAVKHIELIDHMTLKMEPGAVLKAKPNNRENFSVITIKQVTDVTVIGGLIQGERNEHQGKTGEWGMGLDIRGASNVVIEKVITKDNWGDGFYVADNASNITVCDVVTDNSRRHGMSVVSADNVTVKDSVFQRAAMCGIDIEPNIDKTVNNVQITGSQFLQNQRCGISFTLEEGNVGRSSINNGLIEGNLIANNGTPEEHDENAGIMFYFQHGIKVINNTVKNNFQDGLTLNTGSKANLVTGNTFINNGQPYGKIYGRGILIYQANKNIIENNTALNNFKYDIYDYAADNILRNNQAKNIKIGP